MTLKTKPYKFAQNIRTDSDTRKYLQIFFQENGIQGLFQAIKHIAKANIPKSKFASLLKKIRKTAFNTNH